MAIEIVQVLFRRGLESDIPLLQEGEPGIAIDTGNVYVGSSAGNIHIGKQADINALIESLSELQTTVGGHATQLANTVKKINNVGPDVNGNVTIEDATTDKKGLVQLESSVSSTSITKAATPSSVKAVNDDLGTHKTDYNNVKTDYNAHKVDLVNHAKYAVTTGTANTYAITLSPAPTAYTEGMFISIKVNVSSNDAATLNVNALGAKIIKNADGSNVTDLIANGVYTLRYDGSSFIVQGASGSAGKDVTARNEIMDIKAKLKELNLINFVNKTGLGFYDTFVDDINVDKANTSATHDPLNSQYKFNNDLPVLKSLTTVTGTNISVDRTVYVDDTIQGAKVTAVSNSNQKVTLNYSSNRKMINTSNTAATSNRAKPTILSNGWHVVSYLLSGSVVFRVSKDNGVTWSELCFLTNGTVTDFSVVSKGTTIILLAAIGTAEVWSYKFDAATVADVNLTGVGTSYKVDWLQTALSKSHLVITPNDKLVAVWNSKNVALPNYYNIRISQSTDLGVTWSTPIQLTSSTTVATEYTDVFALAKADGNILLSATQATYIMQTLVLNAGLTAISNTTTLYTGNATYTQSASTMIQIKYGANAGRIGLAWQSYLTSNQYSIATAYSDDGGVTWSAINYAVGQVATYVKRSPSLAQDLTGKVYILFDGLSATNTTYYCIKQVTSAAFVSFTAPTDLVVYGTTNSITPVASDKVEDIVTSPMFTYVDGNTSSVSLSGNYSIDSVTSSVTLNNSVSVTAGQILTLVRNKKLTMNQETFDSYKSVELNVYAQSNKSTVKNSVSNSTALTTTVASRAIAANDKIFMNGLQNTVVSSTPNTVSVNNAATVSQLAVKTFKSAPTQVLSNGWLINAVYETATTKVHFYVSKNNGATWSILTSWTIALAVGTVEANVLSFCSRGNMIYAVGYAPTIYSSFTKFDATTVGSTVATITNNVFGSSYGANGLSIGVSTNGVLFIAGISSSTIYGVKSVDDGTAWTKLDGTTGYTIVYDEGTYNQYNPFIVVQSDTGFDAIAFDSGAKKITYCKFNGTTFSRPLVTQALDSSNPIASLGYALIKQKYGPNAGRIWLVMATSAAVKNIVAYYSTDNGSTWSAAVSITNGTTYSQTNPTLAEDNQGNLYFVWQGYTPTAPSIYNTRMIKYNGSSYGDIIEITNRTDASNLLPIACQNHYSFTTAPIMIWDDAFAVTSYANYNIPDGYSLTLFSPVTANVGDAIFLQDFSAKNNGVDVPLKSIDDEKHVFYKANLSATTTKVEVSTPKVVDCTALAYAVG